MVSNPFERQSPVPDRQGADCPRHPPPIATSARCVRKRQLLRLGAVIDFRPTVRPGIVNLRKIRFTEPQDIVVRSGQDARYRGRV
jgi:hypothetical protein